MFPDECNQGPSLVYDSRVAKGSIPLTFMPIAGPEANEKAIEALAAQAEGVIFAIDSEKTFGAPVIDTFIKPGGALKRVAVMSRYLNGDGMGFFASSAKAAANRDIWAGGKAVDDYRAMEQTIATKCAAAGAEYTVIRAGTLKGGASGSSLTDVDADTEGEAGGEPSFLNPYFYKMGQQDVVNWRLIFDCDNLGVNFVKGDTLPGPGNGAVFTATVKLGQGDSNRGAVATALVEALRAPEAANCDFSVGATQGRTFPSETEWAALFKQAS